MEENSLNKKCIAECNVLIYTHEVREMNWSYDKPWKLLIDEHMNKSELREQTGISTSTLAKMGKNEVVSMNVLAKLCKALQCDIGDIIEYVGKGE